MAFLRKSAIFLLYNAAAELVRVVLKQSLEEFEKDLLNLQVEENPFRNGI